MTVTHFFPLKSVARLAVRADTMVPSSGETLGSCGGPRGGRDEANPGRIGTSTGWLCLSSAVRPW